MNSSFYNNFIGELETNIRNNYDKVSEIFENEYNWPEVYSIRNEICKCIISGYNQAAVMLSNFFLEYLMKISLIIYESRNYKKGESDINNIFSQATKKYSCMNLSMTIDKALEYKLINQ